jgi:(E)-4-hydroxy-3-methylbut-2-enyl-diphosphate synthase
MTTTVTREVEASVSQILKIAAEGGDLVRLTVQGRFEADAAAAIRESLWAKGCDVPLVADIHFSPAVALRVAEAFEKVCRYRLIFLSASFPFFQFFPSKT